MPQFIVTCHDYSEQDAPYWAKLFEAADVRSALEAAIDFTNERDVEFGNDVPPVRPEEYSGFTHIGFDPNIYEYRPNGRGESPFTYYVVTT